ncbi:MAG: hypothetical protein HZB81_04130 [Deltaproteobacteria bacterium]|nr:hypothetical protein [Deltaproteobacteria bacterium]
MPEMINDKFWFELSKEIVKNGTEKRNEAGAKLQTLIAWLWGIYTAGATVGISLSKTSYSLPIILLIASPSIVLIVAYWVAVWVQMPVSAKFDPRIPQDIMRAYLKGVKTKSWRLTIAVSLSFIAAVLVSFALIVASLSKEGASPNFKAYHHAKDDSNFIAISGRFPADTKIILRIISFPPSGSPIISKELPYITSSSGELQESIELKPTTDKYDVAVEWKEEDGLVRSLKRMLLVESKDKQH